MSQTIIQIINILLLTLIIMWYLPMCILLLPIGVTRELSILLSSTSLLLYLQLSLVLQFQLSELLSKWK